MMLTNRARDLRARRRNQTKSNKRRLFVEQLEDRRMLAVIAVTTTADSLAADAACSLREAIINANTDSATHPDCAAGTGVDTIDVPGGTYALSLAGTLEDAAASGDLDIGDPIFGFQTLTIDGVGPTPTIIDATALGDRVFHVHLLNTATFSDVTIKGGVATDDGFALGTGQGGGILNDFGTLTLLRTVIEGNTAVGDFGFGNGLGGGLYDSLGPATTIIDSVIKDNSAIGGIDFSGTTGNGQGGGIYAVGTTGTISGTTISGNTASGGTTLSPLFIPGQGGVAEGGGVYSLGSSWSMVSGTTVSGNFALGGTADPFSGADGGAARGAGIYSGGLWTAENITISGNTATGGAGDAPGVSGVAEGGGWFAGGGTAATISHLTIAFNDATGGPGSTGEAGGVFVDPGGTVFSGGTIIAKNTASTLNPDASGGFVSLDFNLIGDGTGSAGFTGASDQVGTGVSPIDPLLGPLTSNGGLTETHALLTGSTAIDMADPIIFPVTDQRGVFRPDGAIGGAGVSDIGAYEVVRIDIEKSTEGLDADTPTGPFLLTGASADFEYLVTTPDGAPLTMVVVIDDNGTPGTGDDFSPLFDSSTDLNANGILETGETWKYTASKPVTAGQFTNIGSVTAVDAFSGIAVVTDADPSNHFGADPQIEIEKLVSVDGGTVFVDADSPTGPTLVSSGPAPEFKYEVSLGTGLGSVPLSSVTVTDSVLGAIAFGGVGDDGDLILEAGETWIYTATGTWAAGQQTNTGTASGSFTDFEGTIGMASAMDDANYFGAVPQIEIEKLVSVDGGTVFVDADSPTGPTLLSSGPAPEFKYEVTLGTGTGAVDLSNVAVTDSVLGAIAGPASGDDGDLVLEAGETWVFLATGTWAAGQNTNTGSADGDFTDDGGNLAAATTATDDANYFGAAPQIEIEKLVSVDGGTVFVDADSPTGPTLLSSGPAPEFKYEVTLGTGTGAVDLSNVAVTDSVLGAIAGPASGDDGDLVLEAGETWVFLATGTWAAGQNTNTGSADGDFTDDGGNLEAATTATDDANYFGAVPQIEIEKLVSVDGGTVFVDADSPTGPTLLSSGPAPEFKYEVTLGTGTGAVDLSNVAVTDSVLGAIAGPASGDDGDLILEAGETWVFLATGTWAAGQNTNTGSADGDFTDDGGNLEAATTATDDANYFGAAPQIEIEKLVSVDGGTVFVDADSPTGPTLLSSGPAPEFKYEVTLGTGTGAVDLSNVAVTDSVLGAIAGPASGDDGDLILEAGETWVFLATGTWAAGQNTNTGSADGDFTDDGGNLEAATTATDDANYFGAVPQIEIEKLVSVDGGTVFVDADSPTGPTLLSSGPAPEFKYEVTLGTGTGAVDLSNVAVTDSVLGAIAGPASGDDGDLVLEAGETWVFLATGTWAAGQNTNTGSADGDFTDDGGNLEAATTATDDANYFGAVPQIEIEKLVSVDGGTVFVDADSPTGPTVLSSGPAPEFKYEVTLGTGTGAVDLSNVAVTDSVLGAIAGPASGDDGDLVLEAGETWVFLATGTWAAGQNTNTGSADGDFTDDGGNLAAATTATDDANYFGAAPQIEIEKLVSVDGGTVFVDADSPTGPTLVSSGPAPEFKYEVTLGTGTGAVDLSNVAVTDSVLGAIAGPASGDDGDLVLEAGETWVFLATGTWAAGQNTNTGSADGDFTDDGGNLAAATTATDDANYFGAAPQIEIEKLVSVDGGTVFVDADSPTGPTLVSSGPAPEFKYEVTLGSGTGAVDLSNVAVTDSVLGAIAGPASGDDGDLVLEAGETWVFLATGTWAAGQNTNTGSADGDFTDDGGNLEAATTATDDANYFGAVPQIEIEKLVSVDGGTVFVDADSPTGPTLLSSGSAPEFKYEVTLGTGTGAVDLSNVAVTDSVLGAIAGPASGDDGDLVLEAGETWVFLATGTWAAGQNTNTGSADGDFTDDGGNLAAATTATDDANYFGAVTGIVIEKATEGLDADAPTGPLLAVGSTANFTYVVTNTGSVPLANVVVTDDQGVTVTFASGDSNFNNLLDLTETWTYTGSTTVTAGQYTNIGTATGDFTDGGGNFEQASDNDPSNHFGVVIGINVEKSTEGEDADTPTGPIVEAGSPITFDYVVTNTGNVALANVVVSDDNGTPGTGDDFNPTFVGGDTNTNLMLDLGETWTYTFPGSAASGQYTNVATATADDATGTIATPAMDTDASNHFGLGDNPITCNPAEAYSALIITGATTSPFPTGTFPGGYFQTFPTGSESFPTTFDHTFIPSGLALDPDWAGTATFSYSMLDSNTTSNAFQAVGDRVTEYHDFDPGVIPNRSGSVFNTYGRGHFTYNGSSGGSDHLWQVSYDFTSLANGYLPAGTVLGFSDIDGISVANESVLLAATLDSGGSDAWLSYADDAPNPEPGHGLAGYDSLNNSYEFDGPDASNDHIAYQTTEDLTTVTITVTQGMAGSSLGMRFIAPLVNTCISGTVRNDTAGDDTLDGDEPGIPGVLVGLFTDPNGDGNPSDGTPIGSTVTGTDGTYEFPNQTAGDYVIVEVDPVGAVSDDDSQGAPTDNLVGISIDGINPSTDNDFLDDIAATSLQDISGTVFDDDDTSNDGIFGPDDDPIGGVLLTLYRDTNGNGLGEAGELVGTTMTLVDGTYTFSALPDGTYVVVESDPFGAVSENDTQGDPLDNIIVLTLAGADSTGNNFLDDGAILQSISGQVRDDLDVDGDLTDPDPGIASVTVTLFTDPNGDGDPSDGVQIDQTTTDTFGDYQFTVVPAGTYVVEETDPAGFVSTSDTDPPNDNRVRVTLVGGVNSSGNDFLDAMVSASIDIEKLTNGVDADSPTGPLIAVGGTATFDYSVINTGNLPLANVVVTDDNGTPGTGDDFNPTFVGGDTNANNLLDVGETWTYTANRIVTAGQYTNVGSVTGDDSTGMMGTTVVDSDPSNHFGVLTGIDIEKSTQGVDADTPTGPLLPVGVTTYFLYYVTNTGNVPLSNVVVTDDAGTPGAPGDDFNPIFAVGDTNANNLLDLGETWIYYELHVVTPGQYGNIGDATADDSTGTVSGPIIDDDPSHHFGVVTDVEIEKLTNGVDADDPADAPQIAPNDPVTWTYQVSNPGNVPLSSVVVTDDNGTPGDTGDDFNPAPVLSGAFNVGDTNMDGLLDPGEVWLYSANGLAQDLSVVIDFETDGLGTPLSAGTFVDTEYANFGLTVSTNTTYGAMIFDSDNPTGGDWDLETPGTGPGNTVARDNILIISEDGDQSDPDDNATGGTIIFEWDVPVEVNDVGILDIDLGETGGTIVTFDAGGGVIGSHSIPATGNNGYQALSIGDDLVSRMEVTLVGSGAMTDVSFNRIYENVGSVLADGVTDSDLSHYQNPLGIDAIDIEKFTNGVNADNPSEAPEIAPGSTVTWTYEVTTAGPGFLAGSEIEIVDDAGTPSNPSDDFSITSGDITFVSGDDGDGNLEVGETWIYQATGVAQDLGTPGGTVTIEMTGSSSTDGPEGNIRTFSAGGISVKASAFSRDSGVWDDSYLGAYSSGLGVTDASEGSGGGGLHRVDNVGRLNYILFAFSEDVIVDRTFLDNVGNDSDLSIWVGTIPNAFTVPVTLSDTVLNDLDVFEVNNTSSSSSRWADVNAGAVTGNVLVLAASTVDSTPEDRFKIRKVEVQETTPGIYKNTAEVTTGPEGPTDTDMSHYRNPDGDILVAIEKHTNGADADDSQGGDVPVIEPGNPVNWTYFVTNTGDIDLDFADVVVVDDNGTPGDAGDDFTPTFVPASDVGGDLILSVGETWEYFASDTADILLTVINFDDLAGGTLVNEQYDDVGLTISTNDMQNHPAMIFNSASPTGGDTDLVTPGYGLNNDLPLGSILIISEDADESDPDDNAAGGTLIFEFDELVRINRIGILDIDLGEAGGSVTTFDAGGSVISSHPLANLGDNSFQSIGIGDEGVARLEVTLAGSGAVTELSFDRIYSNVATVTVDTVSDSDPSHYRNPPTEIDPVAAYKRFFVVDTYVDKTFEYDADGTPLESNSLAGANYTPSGITMTVDGQTNWVVDRYAGVFVYDEDGNNLGQWNATGLSQPEGIATNETDVWIVDDGTNTVYFYANAASRLSGSQAPASSFALAAGNSDPSGITMSGQTIWVVNDGATQNDIFVYDLNGTLQGSWTAYYTTDPRGITINPGDVNDLWIVDAHYDAVYEYVGGAFFTSGIYKPNNRWMLDANNHSAEGIADPPPPEAKDSVLIAVPRDVVHSTPSNADDRVLGTIRLDLNKVDSDREPLFTDQLTAGISALRSETQAVDELMADYDQLDEELDVFESFDDDVLFGDGDELWEELSRADG